MENKTPKLNFSTVMSTFEAFQEKKLFHAFPA